MVQRLQKVIAESGFCSRRKAETHIQEGSVTVNGRICTTLGTKVDIRKDQIVVKGTPLHPETEKVYYLFYKPRQVVSTLYDPQRRSSLAHYIKEIPQRVYPVGRLDYDSEGLMILTNDGELTHQITHPSRGIHKIYCVQMTQVVTPQQIQRLRRGAVVEGKPVKPIRVSLSDKKDWIRFELAEGRKREIRVFAETAGLTIKRLIRESIGRLTLGDLGPGQLKKISSSMIREVFS